MSNTQIPVRVSFFSVFFFYSLKYFVSVFELNRPRNWGSGLSASFAGGLPVWSCFVFGGLVVCTGNMQMPEAISFFSAALGGRFYPDTSAV